jgi:hypothetical protein
MPTTAVMLCYYDVISFLCAILSTWIAIHLFFATNFFMFQMIEPDIDNVQLELVVEARAPTHLLSFLVGILKVVLRVALGGGVMILVKV